MKLCRLSWHFNFDQYSWLISETATHFEGYCEMNFSDQSLLQLQLAATLDYIFHFIEPEHLEVKGSDFDAKNDLEKVPLCWYFSKSITVKAISFKYIVFDKKLIKILRMILKANQASLDKLYFYECFFSQPIEGQLNSVLENIKDFNMKECCIRQEDLFYILSSLPLYLKQLHLSNIRWNVKKVTVKLNFPEMQELTLENMDIEPSEMKNFRLPKLKKLLFWQVCKNFKKFSFLHFSQLQELYLNEYEDYLQWNNSKSKLLPSSLKVMQIWYTSGNSYDSLYEKFLNTGIIFKCQFGISFLAASKEHNLKYFFMMDSIVLDFENMNDTSFEQLMIFMSNNSGNLTHITCIRFIGGYRHIEKLFAIFDYLPNISHLVFLMRTHREDFTRSLAHYQSHHSARQVKTLSFEFCEYTDSSIRFFCNLLLIYRNISNLILENICSAHFSLEKVAGQLNAYCVQLDNLADIEISSSRDDGFISILILFLKSNTVKSVDVNFSNHIKCDPLIMNEISSISHFSIEKFNFSSFFDKKEKLNFFGAVVDKLQNLTDLGISFNQFLHYSEKIKNLKKLRVLTIYREYRQAALEKFFETAFKCSVIKMIFHCKEKWVRDIERIFNEKNPGNVSLKIVLSRW